MARRALRVRVEIVKSPEGPLLPRPGRIMVVPPHVTFLDFGVEIDRALGRWDLDLFRSFRWTPAASDGPVALAYRDRVAATLHPGDVFSYDSAGWLHEGTVQCFDDVLEAYGRETGRAHAIMGWGAVPDQRGHTAPPSDSEPGAPAPLWPGRARLHRLDRAEVRRATYAADLLALVRAVTGCDLRHALQEVGGALLRTRRASGGVQSASLSEAGAETARLLAALSTLLRERGWPGDPSLANDIDTELSGAEPSGDDLSPDETVLRPLEVQLPDLIEIMTSGGEFASEGTLNLDTGEIRESPFERDWDEFEDEETAESSDEQEWTHVAYIESGSRDGWYDMSDFADLQHDENVADRLRRAIEGRGAFRRFRDAVDHLDLSEDWLEFSGDRELGRARKFLAEYGVRPV